VATALNKHQPPAKFRKKPVVIEAMPFDGTYQSGKEIMAWADQSDPEGFIFRVDLVGLEVRTLEGDMTVLPGDWVIRGVKGEFYPCRNDIFAATYEPAEEA
jgi:hypothetical protein